MDVHESALEHGIGDEDIRHAVDHPFVVSDLDNDSEVPKLFVIGPDRAGNMLEVIVLVLAEERFLAVHAMRLRANYYDLLPPGGDDG